VLFHDEAGPLASGIPIEVAEESSRLEGLLQGSWAGGGREKPLGSGSCWNL
jgi:hypothetical protein